MEIPSIYAPTTISTAYYQQPEEMMMAATTAAVKASNTNQESLDNVAMKIATLKDKSTFSELMPEVRAELEKYSTAIDNASGLLKKDPSSFISMGPTLREMGRNLAIESTTGKIGRYTSAYTNMAKDLEEAQKNKDLNQEDVAIVFDSYKKKLIEDLKSGGDYSSPLVPVRPDFDKIIESVTDTVKPTERKVTSADGSVTVEKYYDPKAIDNAVQLAFATKPEITEYYNRMESYSPDKFGKVKTGAVGPKGETLYYGIKRDKKGNPIRDSNGDITYGVTNKEEDAMTRLEYDAYAASSRARVMLSGNTAESTEATEAASSIPGGKNDTSASLVDITTNAEMSGGTTGERMRDYKNKAYGDGRDASNADPNSVFARAKRGDANALAEYNSMREDINNLYNMRQSLRRQAIDSITKPTDPRRKYLENPNLSPDSLRKQIASVNTELEKLRNISGNNNAFATTRENGRHVSGGINSVNGSDTYSQLITVRNNLTKSLTESVRINDEYAKAFKEIDRKTMSTNIINDKALAINGSDVLQNATSRAIGANPASISVDGISGMKSGNDLFSDANSDIKDDVTKYFSFDRLVNDGNGNIKVYASLTAEGVTRLGSRREKVSTNKGTKINKDIVFTIKEGNNFIHEALRKSSNSTGKMWSLASEHPAINRIFKKVTSAVSIGSGMGPEVSWNVEGSNVKASVKRDDAGAVAVTINTPNETFETVFDGPNASADAISAIWSVYAQTNAQQ